MATSPWRDGPDLVVIGVKRGGTTSLFRDLERHPAMCPLVPSARRLPLRENQKGVHFFDSNFDRGHTWYRSHFPTRLARRIVERRSGSTFTAEASPYYFFHPLAAARTAAALPDALFVVLLRDPVERTVSHWSEQTRNGVETLSLRDALEAERSRLGSTSQQLASGAIAGSHAHEQQSYATQSEYVDSLRRWFDAAGRSRVHVAFSEDYYHDPSSVIGAITDRLGVAPMPRHAVGGHRNAAPRPSEVEAETERDLVDRFRPDVERVAQLLGTQPPWPRFEAQQQRAAADGSA
jgi:Sulfotransferase family